MGDGRRYRFGVLERRGVIGGLRGDIEYAVTPTLAIGGLLRYDQAANWSETRGMLFARYRLP